MCDGVKACKSCAAKSKRVGKMAKKYQVNMQFGLPEVGGLIAGAVGGVYANKWINEWLEKETDPEKKAMKTKLILAAKIGAGASPILLRKQFKKYKVPTWVQTFLMGVGASGAVEAVPVFFPDNLTLTSLSGTGELLVGTTEVIEIDVSQPGELAGGLDTVSTYGMEEAVVTYGTGDLDGLDINHEL